MKNIVKNADGSYLSPNEIVEDMLSRTEEPFTADWLATHTMSEREEFLRWIRNSYGMWKQDNPYVVINDPASNFEGVRDFPLFPDNLSMHLCDRFIQWAKGSAQPVTMTCRLDDEQVAEIKAHIDAHVELLKPKHTVVQDFSINIADNASFRASGMEIRADRERAPYQVAAKKKIPDVYREPPPTYVRVGVTDQVVCATVEVLLDGVKLDNAIGADSAMGYVLTETWKHDWVLGITTAFGRRDGDVEIRWAQ